MRRPITRPMVTIVYVSRAAHYMEEAALAQLLSAARDRNAQEGVTGMLLYAYESFAQVLEGEAEAVDRIFASIAADSRHTDLRLLNRRPLSQRRYGGWTMGFEHPGAESPGRRMPTYNPSLQYPLVSSDLITTPEVAENLLALLASQKRDHPARP